MKDARDKNNEKSITAKSDTAKDSGQGQVDSPASAKASDKITKNTDSISARSGLSNNPIAQVFEQVTKSVEQAQKSVGDITNAALNTVTHNDLGKQFVDNVSPELASEYQKGKKLIESRISKGLDPSDLSGLNATQKRQVEAYNKIHAELPSKIPFYNQEALSRQIDQALSQKNKSMPPSTVAPAKMTQHPVSRNSSNLTANQLPPSASKDVSRPQARSAEVKTSETRSNTTKSTEVRSSEFKNADNRTPVPKNSDKMIDTKSSDKAHSGNISSASQEQDRDPKPSLASGAKNDGIADTPERQTERQTELKNTATSPSKDYTASTAKAPPLAPGDRPVSKPESFPSAPKNMPSLKGGDGVTQVGSSRSSTNLEQNIQPKTQTRSDQSDAVRLTATGDAVNMAPQKTAQPKVESPGLSPSAATRAQEDQKLAKRDAGFAAVANQKPDLAGMRDPIGEVLGHRRCADNSSGGRAIESSAKRTADYLKDAAFALEIGKYRTLTVLAKDKLLPVTRCLTQHDDASRALLVSASSQRSQFIWTSPRLVHANSEIIAISSAKPEQTSVVVNPKTFVAHNADISHQANETSKGPANAHLIDTGITGGGTVIPDRNDVVKTKNNSLPPLSADSLFPEVQKDSDVIGANTKRVSLSDVSPVANDSTRRVVRDLKYITGAELVFAVIVAVAGTARARSTEPLLQSVRLESVIAAESDSEVVACAQDLTQLVSDTIGQAVAARPQILVALDDTLTQIAARLYGDPAIAWLIAALNPQCQYYYNKNQCLVRLKVRQSVTLPVFDDLKSFARLRLPYMVADNIFTVVEDTAVNKEVLSDTFAGLLGLDSFSVDPLQKVKKAQT